jgi:hypothetical protein
MSEASLATQSSATNGSGKGKVTMATPKGLKMDLDPHVFAENTGRTFTGMTLGLNEDGAWMCILRALDQQGDYVYSMAYQDSPNKAYESLMEAICSKQGGMLWRWDKYKNINEK